MNKAKKIIAYVIMLAFITQWVPVVNTYAIEPINLENLNEVTADHGTTDSGAESAGSTDNVTTSGAVSGGLIDNGTTTDGGAVSGGSTDNGATTGSGAIGDGTAGHGTMDDVPPKNSNTLADIEPPNAPENLDYVINKNSITLTWSASTDNVGVIGYRIYNDNNYINTTSDLTYTISKDTEIKYFSVAAVDEAGNVSLKKSISISQDQDTEPPSQPTDLICVGKSDTEVGLLWTKSTDNYGVAGYYIYNGREIIGTTADSTYSITSLLDHTQYTFTVKAFDFAGNLSSVSNEVIVTTGLDVPENVVAIPDGTSIIVSWDEVYGAAYYDLMINDTLITDINTNSYTCEGLTQGKTYIIQVRAKSNANQKESASEINKQSDNIDLKTTAGWSATIEVDLNVSGTISEDTVWTAANSPYVLTNNIIISKGVTLTVEAGTVIESPSYRITVNGTLNANGTARSPVVFTTPDEATPDYWSYLSVGSTGVMNLNYTEVRYAGSSDYAIFSSGYANITNSKVLCAEEGGVSNSGEMDLNYTDIEALDGYGIYNTGKISVTNSSISGNYKHVIYNVSTSGDVLLTDNQIIGTGKSGSAGIYLYRCSGGNLTLSNNTITNTIYPVIVNLTYYNPTTATGLWNETIDGIGLTGNLTTNLTLPKKTYQLTGDVTVNSGVTLTVEAGAVIESPSYAIIVKGTLNANGTAESPVVFTTSDETTPRYWSYLSVGSTGVMHLNHTEVRYAGSSDYAIFSSGYANITNSKILCAEEGGVSNSGEMDLNYTDIEALGGYGIYNSGKISATNSSISGNYKHVIYNVSTSGDVLLTDNQIIGTGKSGSAGIYLYRCSGGNLTLSNNTITNTIYPVIVNLTYYNPTTATGLWDETIDGVGLTGNLTTNLTLPQKTYQLTGDVTVNSLVVLTVEAGTVIESPSYKITVNGTLNANGTAESPVVFTTPDENTPDYWIGLSVGSTGVMNLNYTEVRYAGSSDYAIFSSGYANITNSKILYAEKGGASNSGEMNLDYTDIEALGNYGIYNTGKISVTNSSISGNDKRVIYVSTSGDVLLTDNQIIGIGKSESVGVYLNKCSGGNLTLSDNTITNAMYPVIVNLTYYNPTTATGLWDETIDGIGLTGNLTTNLTLPKKTYRLTESVTVNSDATLTIEAGTVIKSPSDKITVNGTLNANGTAESPVVFTTPDENTPDYWIGLSVGNTGTMNLNHTEVRYAGTIDYAIVSSGYANITNSKILYAQKRGVSNSGEMNLNYTDIEALDGYGIYNTGKISVTNSSISGNYNRVIYVSTSEDVLLTDNQIIGTGESGSVGIYLYRCSGGNLTLSNNTITDTIYPVIINLNFYNPATVLWDETIDDIGLTGDLATNLTLPKKTYQLTGSVAVNSGVTLTIEAGTVIESLLNSITVNGTLNANGTAESPVVFTTRDEATPTYWVGLVVNSTGVINLDYSKIRYAGALDYAAIKSSGQITITNSEISYSQTGIYHNSTIQPIIKYNSFLNNTNYALYNAKSSTMTIDATNNYWGSEDGPALYSSGTWSTDGGKISSGITYIPFLGNINAVSADLSYLSSTTPSDAITARVTVHNENVNANRSYFVEAYCSWDEETWYYKGGSEVTIPAGATSSDVDLQYSIYQTGNLHSKVIIYNDGGGTRLGESFKSDTDYVAVWYHFTIENPENTTEQYVSSVENINDPTYLILKQSDEELWKQYVLERNAWTDTGITYDVEPFTENWVLNGGSKSTSKNNLSTQSLNSNGLLNVLHITKTSTEIASEIIQNNAQYILDAAIMYGVDSKIVAGVIYAEQSLNVNILDNADYIVAFYGILDTSLGVGQVKMSTAKLLEDEGYVSKASASEGGWNIPIIGFIHGTETMAREKRLENDQQNIIYVAADLKYWQNMWEDEYPQISEDPAILGTLYNLGTRANAPNPNPQSNPFGEYVEENYDYMGDLLGLTEI